MQDTDVAQNAREDDIRDSCHTTPADGSSQSSVPSPALTGGYPPLDDATSSSATPAPPTDRNRQRHVWDPANGHEYTCDGEIRRRCSRCINPHFMTFDFRLVVNADMKSGPYRNTAPSFAVTNTKNSVMHQSDVRRIGQNGQLPEVTEEEERIYEAFVKAGSRVSFNRTVSRQLLIRWVTTCNISMQGAQHDSCRPILVYLASCVSTYYFVHLVSATNWASPPRRPTTPQSPGLCRPTEKPSDPRFSRNTPRPAMHYALHSQRHQLLSTSHSNPGRHRANDPSSPSSVTL